MQVLKDEIRDRILDSTQRIINEEGIDKVSIRKISVSSNTSPANIYNYFVSKNSIIEYIVKPYVEETEKLLDKLFLHLKANNETDFEECKKFIRNCVIEFSEKLYKFFKYADNSIYEILTDKKYVEQLEYYISKLLKESYYNIFKLSTIKESDKSVMITLTSKSLVNCIYYLYENLEDCEKNNIDISNVLSTYICVVLCLNK